MNAPLPSLPPWARPHEPAHRSAGGDLRVSDADRAAVGEVLSKHYAAGRLDDAEFTERLDRAMAAKTRADLRALTGDLPPLEVSAPPPPLPRHRWPVLGLVLVAAVVLSTMPWVLAARHAGGLLVAIVVLLAWHRLSWRSSHRQDRRSPAAPPPSA